MTSKLDQGCSIIERPAKQLSWSELIAGTVCLVGSLGYLSLIQNLPAGFSRGDVGPAAMPYGVAFIGIVMSFVLLFLAFRTSSDHRKPNFTAFRKITIFIGAFLIVPIVANYIGLAISLGAAAGLVTLLFSGNRKYIRALSTAVGAWLIAELLFTRFLGLPLP